jgi:hypothetical protein
MTKPNYTQFITFVIIPVWILSYIVSNYYTGKFLYAFMFANMSLSTFNIFGMVISVTLRWWPFDDHKMTENEKAALVGWVVVSIFLGSVAALSTFLA